MEQLRGPRVAPGLPSRRPRERGADGGGKMRSLGELLRLGLAYRQAVETPDAPPLTPAAPRPLAPPLPAPVPTQAPRHFTAPPTGELATYPPPERWDDWVEDESKAWPQRE